MLVHLLSFLEQWHAGNLLQLSTATPQAIAPAIHALKLPVRVRDRGTRSIFTLGRLLARLSSLRQLHIHSFLEPRGRVTLMQDLRDGPAGQQLEALHVSPIDQDTCDILSTVLDDGRLPRLRKLELDLLDLRRTTADDVLRAVCRVLNDRVGRGLAPITDVRGVSGAQPLRTRHFCGAHGTFAPRTRARLWRLPAPRRWQYWGSTC